MLIFIERINERVYDSVFDVEYSVGYIVVEKKIRRDFFGEDGS